MAGEVRYFSVDNNHGNAFDFVSGLHFHGLVAQHLDVKRLEHFSEFLAVDAVLFDEIENLFIRSQIDSLHLYRFKNLVVKLRWSVRPWPTGYKTFSGAVPSIH